MTRSQIANASTALTDAQRAAREVQTEPQARDWIRDHYYPLVEIDALHDEITAMHEDIVRRVCGAGGG